MESMETSTLGEGDLLAGVTQDARPFCDRGFRKNTATLNSRKGFLEQIMNQDLHARETNVTRNDESDV